MPKGTLQFIVPLPACVVVLAVTAVCVCCGTALLFCMFPHSQYSVRYLTVLGIKLCLLQVVILMRKQQGAQVCMAKSFCQFINASYSNIFCRLLDTLLAGSCCIEFSCTIWCEGAANANKNFPTVWPLKWWCVLWRVKCSKYSSSLDTSITYVLCLVQLMIYV